RLLLGDRGRRCAPAFRRGRPGVLAEELGPRCPSPRPRGFRRSGGGLALPAGPEPVDAVVSLHRRAPGSGVDDQGLVRLRDNAVVLADVPATPAGTGPLRA